MQAVFATAKKKRLLIPREHGAWGILLVPFFIGFSVAWQWDEKAILLLGAVLFLFLARYPLVLWARSGFEKFPAGGLLTFSFASGHGLFLGILLIFRYQLWLLAALGAIGVFLLLIHLLLVRQRRERTGSGEFLGICALTLTAPAAFYTSSGTLSQVAFLLWFLCVLHFGASVFYVKMKLARRFSNANPKRTGDFKLARSLVLYQAAAFGSSAALSVFQLAPALIFLTFVPLAVHVMVDIFKKDKELSIRKLGFTLVGHSVAYGLILIAIFRVSSVDFL